MSVSIGLITQTIERIAPKSWAEEWDNVGLLVGDASTPVKRVLITLDGTLEVVKEAQELEAQLIIAHHPIIFRPLKNLRSDNLAAQVPLELVRSGISYYAAHTNLDQSSLNSSLSIGNLLGMTDMECFAVTNTEKLMKLVVYVPRTHEETVRQALVKVGVGEEITDGPHSANYAECFFAGVGTGMFRPLEGADPTIGSIGELTKVEEVRLESLMSERIADKAVRALKRAHPYEEPAFDLIPLNNKGQARGFGVIGYLSEPKTLEEIRNILIDSYRNILPPSVNLDDNFRVPYTGDKNRLVKKIAILNGSGGSFVPKAIFKGVDLYIAGDLDHHAALDALEAGMSIMDLGHFWSEVPMVNALYQLLSTEKALKDVEFIVSKKMNNPWKY